MQPYNLIEVMVYSSIFYTKTKRCLKKFSTQQIIVSSGPTLRQKIQWAGTSGIGWKPIGLHCEIAIKTLNYFARTATTQLALPCEIN